MGIGFHRVRQSPEFIESENSQFRRTNRVAGWGILAFAILALNSLFISSFVPSSFTVAFAKIAALVAALFYGAFFFGIGHFGWDLRSPKVLEAMHRNRIAATPYLRVPLMACVMGGFAWMGFSAALPWALNAVFGKVGTMDVVIGGWQDSFYGARSGQQCARPTIAGVPFMMLGRNALCVGNDHAAADFPVGAKMVLYGRVSVFGIDPNRYHCCTR